MLFSYLTSIIDEEADVNKVEISESQQLVLMHWSEKNKMQKQKVKRGLQANKVPKQLAAV